MTSLFRATPVSLGHKKGPDDESRTIKVTLFSQKQVRRVLVADGCGTKHALAEIIAKRFPEDLCFRLPAKRRPWMSEDSRRDIFDAVALALMVG